MQLLYRTEYRSENIKMLVHIALLCLLVTVNAWMSCPRNYPYAYRHGRACCKNNREAKEGVPGDGEACDGSIISYESNCCYGMYIYCKWGVCEHHRVALQCPKSHPFAYQEGSRCCKYNQEKIDKNHGAKCDGSIISFSSQCCRDDQSIKCVEPGKCTSNDIAWRVVKTGGKFCNHPGIQTRVSPAFEYACLDYCEREGKNYCMWEYGVGDGFCMASNECSNQALATDNRRYAVFKREEWILLDTGGKYCDHPEAGGEEKYVIPQTQEACKRYCESVNTIYCMWDYVKNNGYCLMTNKCTKLTMPINSVTRYIVWTRRVSMCPQSHPFAYYNSEYCCKYNEEKTYKPQGARCDGSKIGFDSLCCRDDEFMRCPYGKCSSNNIEIPHHVR